MKIAMVSEHASPLAVLGGVDAGGQNVHVASLASALARQGHEVVVHTRRDDAALPGRVEFCPGVVVEHVNAGPPRPIAKDELLPFMDAFADRLRRSWDNERPEIIHSHFWMSGRAALAAARRLAVPVVHTFHALGVVKKRHQGSKDTSPPQRLPTEDRIIKQCDRILATCSDELFELVRLGADRRKISVVPCGVDPDLFKPDGPAWPRRQGLKRVLVVSRLVERKGIGNVISALTEVPKVEAVIAGGPDATRLDTDPMVRNFRALAARLGVDDRVTLLGSVDRNQVPNLIRSSDVVACVPWYEPFGMVALEAMACGVPVVASAVGGLVDTVVDGVTGIHVPPRRPDEVARALNLLLSEARLRKRMGAAGAERARNRYSWDLIAELTAEAYMLVTEREARTAEAWRRR